MKRGTLKIDVYECKSNYFLGTRFAPYYLFDVGERVISNANEINQAVLEVKELHKANDVYFKTTMLGNENN